ncbi:MAG: M23 family metallopeptidase, partial [Calditrichaeota bacterium]
TGAWHWFGHIWRWLYVLLFFWFAFQGFRRIQPASGNGQLRHSGLLLLVFGFSTLSFLAMTAFALYGYFYDGDFVDLEFPLHHGTYHVAQGGNSPLLNIHHHPRSPLKLALDITRLNGLGIRAWGIYPSDVHRYAIWGDTVYSPLSALVVEAVDSLPDLPASQVDTVNLAGNHVVLRRGDLKVVLAHLQQGSLLVQKGDSVRAGQPIGLVGNSGNTTEPHLHIHAARDTSNSLFSGTPVAMRFRGKFLKRNDRVRSNAPSNP